MMNRKWSGKWKWLLILGCFSLMTLPVSAAADTYYVPLNIAFSNYSPGDGAYDDWYGSVQITDVGTNNVKLAVEVDGAGGLGSDLQYLYFNTVADISGLAIVLGTQNPETPLGSLYYDWGNSLAAYKPGGAGYFDGYVDFGPGSPQLAWVEFWLTGDGLDSTDFLAQSTPSDKGVFTMAVHIQSTMTIPGSEFVGGNPPAVPEPATMLLLGSGLVGLASLRKRFRK